MNPRVSVIVPTYNREEMLSRAVCSILDQDFRDFEVIIVNDGSSDGTGRVARNLSRDDERIRVVTHPSNRGVAATHNSGIKAARGEYIAWLDDDDEWLPGKLSAQVDLLDRSSPEVGVVYCWYEVVDSQVGENVFRHEVRKWTIEGDISEHCLALRGPGWHTMFLARASVVREVMFDESLRAAIGLDFNIRLSQRCHYRLLPQVGVRYRINHGQPQVTHDILARMEFHRRYLERYAEELQARPATLAYIHSRLGFMYLRIGHRGDAAREFALALRTSFWTEMPKYVLRLLKRVSPKLASRLRRPA